MDSLFNWCRGRHFQDRSLQQFTFFCISAQYHLNSPFRPGMATTWAPLSLNLGPTWTHLAPTFGPCCNLAPSCFKTGARAGQIWNPQNNPKHRYFPRFCGIDDTSCWAIFPTLCLCWAQLGVKLSPKGPSWVQHSARYQVAHGKSNLHSNGPKLHHVGPQRSSSAQVEANWPEYGASYAQVASCSATDIQVLPHSTAKSPLLFSLSYSHLFTGYRWYSSRSGSNMRNHLITSVPFFASAPWVHGELNRTQNIELCVTCFAVTHLDLISHIVAFFM
jgi:hypothetical protein